MPHETHAPELDEATVTAVRAAAAGLASQQGRGVPRALIVQLARSAPGRVTILEGRPPVAVVHAPPSGSSSIFAGLTTRERAVARLVARGSSNQQIADELVITLATAKDHVHRILRKTGLPSRAAVGAAWRG